MVKLAEGEFFTLGESIPRGDTMPASFEMIDTYQQGYVYGTKNGRWGRLVTYYQNYQGHGPGWLVEKIDVWRTCCTG